MKWTPLGRGHQKEKLEQLSSSANTRMWVAFAEVAKNESTFKFESTMMVLKKLSAQSHLISVLPNCAEFYIDVYSLKRKHFMS